MTTIPLIIIPAGDLIHDKILVKKKGMPGKRVYAVRFIIATFCAILSVEVPKFVCVISFIGCFCVALTSFVYPPLLHLRCLWKFCTPEKRNSKMNLIVVDVVLFFFGLLIFGFTSVLTFKSMIQQIQDKNTY